MIAQAEERRKIKGIQLSRKNSHISHLFFADDSLLFLKQIRKLAWQLRS